MINKSKTILLVGGNDADEIYRMMTLVRGVDCEPRHVSTAQRAVSIGDDFVNYKGVWVLDTAIHGGSSEIARCEGYSDLPERHRNGLLVVSEARRRGAKVLVRNCYQNSDVAETATRMGAVVLPMSRFVDCAEASGILRETFG